MKRNYLYDAGKEVGEEIFGKAYFGRLRETSEELHPAFAELAMSAFGLFSRPPLERKIRSLCLVATLTALGIPEILRIHVIGALNNGATKEEIEEAIVHVAPYAGVCRARDGLMIAKGCFAKYKPPQDRPVPSGH